MLTKEKLEALNAANRSNGPWFSNDNAEDVLFDIQNFTENEEKLTLEEVREFLDQQPKG